MSLNRAQRAQTSTELRASYRLSGLTAQDVRTGIGRTAAERWFPSLPARRARR
jgi:hypothetical protein